MTEHVRVIQNDSATQLLDGACGVDLTVLKACPDAPEGVLRCACGAEIVVRTTGDA